jgi:dCMP deaminase
MVENLSKERPSWDDYFKELALLTSKRSTCPRLSVGCILVKDNRIISQGYNGYLSGLPHIPIIRENHNIGTIHAEQNSIIDCAKRGVSCNNSIAYITHYPCLNCFKTLAASGIKQINYINNYNNDKEVENLSKLTNINICQLID